MAKRNFELTCRMREDLLLAYRNVYAHCRSQREAYLKTVQHPAPRFYITPKRAYNVLIPMVRGDFSALDKFEPVKKRMYNELFLKLQQLTQRQEFIGKSLYFVCQFLVTQPASEFFISVDTFKDIFPSMRRYGKRYHFNDTRISRQTKRLSI